MENSSHTQGMLLHIRPRLFCKYRDVVLDSLLVEPFGMRLFGSVDLMTGRPYRNKHYAVACRRNSHRRNEDGILIEAPSAVREFSCVAEWIVGGRFLAKHSVHYKLLDDSFDFASDSMFLWYGRQDGSLSDRRPEWAKKNRGPFREPAMELTKILRQGCTDLIDQETGLICERSQRFEMPTLERERLYSKDDGVRVPSIESAFRTGGDPVRPGFGVCMFCGRPTQAWCGCSRQPGVY